MRSIRELMNLLARCWAFGLLASSLHAQVTIQNPQHLEIPEQRVQVLHTLVCRVVAEELHIRESKVQGPVSLVLGERQERTVADEFNGAYTIYLEHWDETTFASSDVRLTIQRMASRNHSEQMAREVIRRVDLLFPVGRDGLRTTSKQGLVPPPNPAGNCVSGIQGLARHDWLCGQSTGRTRKQ